MEGRKDGGSAWEGIRLELSASRTKVVFWRHYPVFWRDKSLKIAHGEEEKQGTKRRDPEGGEPKNWGRKTDNISTYSTIFLRKEDDLPRGVALEYVQFISTGHIFAPSVC